MTLKTIIISSLMATASLSISAQVENAGGVRKRTGQDNPKNQTAATVSDRMQNFFESKDTHDADLAYMRRIYRQLDLTKGANSPLYFPEDVIDGQENLFRIILNLVIDGKIPAYEYLDGREVFTDQYKINVADMLQRFDIYATEAKGSTEKNPRFIIEEADVPTARILNYYVIEKWEFDRRTNRMKTRVEALCPVMNRSGDFGGEAKYPMFWVKFDAIRPYISRQHVFLSDDNNLATHSLDDYFNLGMYDGEIYKTQNLRNLSMAQMFPDEDDRKRAQDSIDNRLRSFGKDLWVPTREEYLAMKEKEAAAVKTAAEGDSIPERTVVVADEKTDVQTASAARAKKRTTTKKTAKAKKTSTAKPKTSSSSASSGAAKSVRRRKK